MFYWWVFIGIIIGFFLALLILGVFGIKPEGGEIVTSETSSKQLGERKAGSNRISSIR